MNCESPHMKSDIWNRDYVKARHTCMCANILHVQATHMRLQHGEYYFLAFLGQGKPLDLDVG